MEQNPTEPGYENSPGIVQGGHGPAGEIHHASEAWLNLALDAAHAGVWDWNVRTGEVKWSENLAQIHGPAEGTFGGTFADFLEGVYPEDREFVEHAMTRAVEQSEDLHIEYRVAWLDGGILWLEGRGKPFYDESGQPVRMLGLCLDITQRKLAKEEYARLLEREQAAYREAEAIRQRLAFLAESRVLLASSLDYEATLKRVARLAVPTFARWCIVDVIEGRLIRRVAVAGEDPEKEGLLHELQRRYPPDWDSPQPAARALRAGRPVFLSEFPDGEWLAATARDGEHLRILRALAPRSVIAAPLVASEHTLGVMTFASGDARPGYGPEDVALAEDLAGRCALAVYNARLYREAQEEIAERQRTEEALRESEERYRKLVETSPDAIVLSDLDSTVLMANEQAAILHGAASVAELVGQNGFGFVVPEDRPRAAENLIKCIDLKITKNLEYGILRKDGTHFPAEVSSSVIVDAEGRPKAFINIVRDITERRRAEEEVRRRSRELAALNAVAAAVSSSLELSEILAALKSVVIEQLKIPGGMICFYDEAQDRLDLETAWGLTQAMLDTFRSTPVARSQDRRVVREKEAIFGPDVRQIEAPACLDPDVPRPRWQGYLSVPLLAKGQVQGVLSLYSEAPTVFDDDRVAFFKAVGQEVGVAIHNARLFEQVRAGRKRLQAVSRRLVEVQEAERRHIARELHDEVGQDLTALKIALTMSARAPAENREAALDRAQELVDRLVMRVRDLSLDLRPAMLDDLGLLAALLWHFDRYTAQTGIRVAFEHAGLGGRFPPQVETAAYRIVQEALTNIARHARVDEATVRLWAGRDLLSIQVIDRGSGFDPEAVLATNATGGLSGMSERASLLGGQLRVESRPGAGTQVTAELPLAVPPGGREETG